MLSRADAIDLVKKALTPLQRKWIASEEPNFVEPDMKTGEWAIGFDSTAKPPPGLDITLDYLFFVDADGRVEQSGAL